VRKPDEEGSRAVEKGNWRMETRRGRREAADGRFRDRREVWLARGLRGADGEAVSSVTCCEKEDAEEGGQGLRGSLADTVLRTAMDDLLTRHCYVAGLSSPYIDSAGIGWSALLENGGFVNGITGEVSIIDQACNKRQTPLSLARAPEW
jgi:hypothetical protein